MSERLGTGTDGGGVSISACEDQRLEVAWSLSCNEWPPDDRRSIAGAGDVCSQGISLPVVFNRKELVERGWCTLCAKVKTDP